MVFEMSKLEIETGNRDDIYTKYDNVLMMYFVLKFEQLCLQHPLAKASQLLVLRRIDPLLDTRCSLLHARQDANQPSAPRECFL